MISLSIPIFAGFASLIYMIHKYLVYPAFFSPLSKIPSAHWSCHVSPLWIYWLRWMGPENKTVYNIHKRKGPILRLGPSELSVNCVEQGLKTIYGGGFEKHDFYPRRFSSYGMQPIFAMKSSKPHSIRKRMVTNVYSKTNILSSPTIRVTSRMVLFDRLLPVLQASSATGKPIEVLSLNYAYSMDTFTAFQFGASLGSNFIQILELREWYLNVFYSRRPYQIMLEEFPRLTSLLTTLGIFPKWLYSHPGELEEWNLSLCDKAEGRLSERASFAVADTPVIYAQMRDSIRKADAKLETTDRSEDSQKMHPQMYPRRLEIASEMLDHNSAASETSGITLTYAYYEVSRRPELMKQLREELMTLSPALMFPPTSDSTAELPDAKEMDTLPLLNAVLMETLRLYAAVPGAQPRMTPEQPVTLAGYGNIPPNIRVQSSAYTLHRNSEVFPSPAEWKPERWLSSSPEQLLEMHRWFWAFGSGGRMCIGSHFAINSMKYALAAIYTNFTTSIADDFGGIEQKDGSFNFTMCKTSSD